MYGSLADADAFHDSRGRAATWTQRPQADRLAALIRASDWVDGFEHRFRGERTAPSVQARAWPRADAGVLYGLPIASHLVPRPIEVAAYEAAFVELVAPGSLSAGPQQGVVTVIAAERALIPILRPHPLSGEVAV
jgi:hypothetical protein